MNEGLKCGETGSFHTFVSKKWKVKFVCHLVAYCFKYLCRYKKTGTHMHVFTHNMGFYNFQSDTLTKVMAGYHFGSKVTGQEKIS